MVVPSASKVLVLRTATMKQWLQVLQSRPNFGLDGHLMWWHRFRNRIDAPQLHHWRTYEDGPQWRLHTSERKYTMTTWYVDLNNGNDSNNGQSFANRKKTLASVASAGPAAGDTVRVMGNASTSSGTASWTNGSSLVTLAAALNNTLYTDGAWTAATNVTASAVTSSPSPKQGSNSCKLACNSSFTTGKIASFALGSAQNLSGY